MSETDYSIPSIIIDVDDVVVDFIPYWLGWLRNEYGISHTPKEAITEWLLSECTPELKELGEEKICRAFDTEGFHLNAWPMPGAIEAVKSLNKDYRLNFVTARHGPLAIDETFKWFKRHLPRIRHDQLIFARRKDIIVGDAAIDDKGDHLRAYRKAPHMEKAIIVGMEQPHNQNDRHLTPYWVSPDRFGWDTAEKLFRNLVYR